MSEASSHNHIRPSARLRYEPITMADQAELAGLHRDTEVMRYISGGLAQTAEQLKRWLQFELNYRREHPALGLWSNRLRDDGSWIGWSELRHLDGSSEIEVGYRYHRRFWGQGLATEAATAMLKYGFGRLNLDEIVAVAVPENRASRRVLEKCGLHFVDTGTWYRQTCVRYRITRKDWLTRQASLTDQPHS